MVSSVRSPDSFFSSLPHYVSHLNPLRLFFPQTEAQSQPSPLNTHHVVNLSSIAQLSETELNTRWNDLLKDVEKGIKEQVGDKLDEKTRNNLEMIFQNLSLEHLRKFLEHLPDLQLTRPDLPLSALALEAIPIDKMAAAIKEQFPEFQTIAEFAADQLMRIPLHPLTSSALKPESQRASNPISNFIYGFIRIFGSAFNVFDTPRPPDTIYEYHVLTMIYFQFFKIPYLVVIALAQFLVSPWNVLITSMVLLGLAIASIYSYMRWLKPCPDQVWYCKTLKNLQMPHAFCHGEELKKALEFMGKGKQKNSRNVVFVGESGVGKTKLMEVLALHLNKKKVFAFDHGSLFGTSDMMVSTIEKMTKAFKEVSGFEDQVVFLHDEAGQALESKAVDMKLLLKTLKDHFPRIQIIMIMNPDQWKKVELDKALLERFKLIEVKETNAKDTLEILKEEAREAYSDIPITRDGLDAMIEITTKKKKGCQPRQALFALEDLAKEAAASYATPNADLKRAEHILAIQKTLSNGTHEIPKTIETRDIETLQQQLRKGLELEKRYIHLRNEALHHLSKAPDAASLKELMFTHFFAFERMKQWLEKYKKDFKEKGFPLMDKAYVEQKLKG